MIKFFLAILVIIFFVGLGGIFYLKFSHKPPTAVEVASNKQSLQDLLLTPNQMCTFQVNDQDSGTLYAAESNFRVDFGGSDNGESAKTHLISDLSNVFLWFDEQKIGIRVPWPIVLDNSELDVIASKILDLGIKVDSECSPWIVDSSKFELPNIDFKNFGPRNPGSIQENEDSLEKKTQCAACLNLDQEAKAKCYHDLDCN